MHIVYDLEIAKAIPPKDTNDRMPGIEYCEGWRDYAGCGISVMATHCLETYATQVYTQETLPAFFGKITPEDVLISFNGLGFDNHVLQANGFDVDPSQCYDLLWAVWMAKGLDPRVFNPQTHGGVGLDALARANGLPGKSGHGSQAGILWQRGEMLRLVNYCVDDVGLTSALYAKALARTMVILSETIVDMPLPGDDAWKELQRMLHATI